jgi:hypothetical protein
VEIFVPTSHTQKNILMFEIGGTLTLILYVNFDLHVVAVGGASTPGNSDILSSVEARTK